LRLGSVAVDRDGLDARGAQLPGDPLGRMSCPAEHEGLPLVGDDAGGDGHALGPGGAQEVMRDSRSLPGLHSAAERVPLVTPDDGLHLRPDCRREEEQLPAFRRRVEEAADRRQESHVHHAVGLVEHGDTNLVQSHITAPDQIL
jgi:hypothetical protein